MLSVREFEKKLDILQMPLPAKTYSGISPLAKKLEKILSSVENRAYQNCTVFDFIIYYILLYTLY